LQLIVFGLSPSSCGPDRRGGRAGGRLSRVALLVFLVVYTAFDSVQGIAVGVMVREGQTLGPDLVRGRACDAAQIVLPQPLPLLAQRDRAARSNAGKRALLKRWLVGAGPEWPSGPSRGKHTERRRKGSAKQQPPRCPQIGSQHR
jgi:hypothetical protein